MCLHNLSGYSKTLKWNMPAIRGLVSQLDWWSTSRYYDINDIYAWARISPGSYFNTGGQWFTPETFKHLHSTVCLALQYSSHLRNINCTIIQFLLLFRRLVMQKLFSFCLHWLSGSTNRKGRWVRRWVNEFQREIYFSKPSVQPKCRIDLFVKLHDSLGKWANKNYFRQFSPSIPVRVDAHARVLWTDSQLWNGWHVLLCRHGIIYCDIPVLLSCVNPFTIL